MTIYPAFLLLPSPIVLDIEYNDSRHKASNISLDNKEKWYGVILVKVGRFYPSKKTCQLCGHFKSGCLFQIATILAQIAVS